ncbi:MAG TPA: M23 family metallopeptidase [Candidatus Saccharimonadales bacterium]|jgi:murein DD-endopeptidase MepM/ murein hydrolase activator NlpD
MHGSFNTISDKLRWLFLAIPVLLVILFGYALLAPVPASENGETAGQTYATPVNMLDSPNAVTAGLSTTVAEASVAVDVAEHRLSGNSKRMAATAANSGKAVGSGALTAVKFTGNAFIGSWKFTGRLVGSAASLTARAIVGTAGFTAHVIASTAAVTGRAINSSISFAVLVPQAVFGFAADTTLVSAVIQPGANTEVPVIDTGVPATIAAQPTIPEAKTVSHKEAPPVQPAPKPVTDDSAAWPIHGDITTLFGVPHWPYQPTHSGIDISDGKAPGITPVKPFRPGTVTGTIRSYGGLGNHVVVDHGGGMTSVYAHLAGISVQVGQVVDKNTVLGTEGSTGASTGTHLHLEIRINGVAVDPRPYLPAHQ